MSSSEWNIRSGSHNCAVCQRAFADEEKFSSRLLLDKKEGFVRSDVCASCAAQPPAQHADSSEPKTLISVWTSVFHAPKPPKEEAVKKETAENLLRDLIALDEPDKKNVIFILAVMLERRRIFAEKEVQVQPDGQKIRVYEHKKSGEVFVVTDPNLKLREIETVQREVMDLLGLLDSPAPSSPPPLPSSADK